MALEAVILAAGRGQRMEGLAKPFFKPLLELNGIPLLKYAIQYADAAQVDHVTIVVSPSNADDIEQITAEYGPWVSTIVQEHPFGPGHAAMLGIEQVLSKKTMLLMSDNIMNTDTIVEMADTVRRTDCDAVGIRYVELDKAARFTRVRLRPSGLYSYVEGVEINQEDVWPLTRESVVWCGPLVFDTEVASSVLSRAFLNSHITNDGAEIKIGPHLDQIMSVDTSLFDVEAFDVGIPSVYIQQQNDNA